MRRQKLETAWREFFQKPPTEQSLLEGAVLMAQLGQIDGYNPSRLFTDVVESIDKIVVKVRKLVGTCSVKSASRTISFINQVLYEEMRFKRGSHENSESSIEERFIDRVRTNHFSFCII